MTLRLLKSLILIVGVSMCYYDTPLLAQGDQTAEEAVLTQEVAELKARVEHLETVTSLLLATYQLDKRIINDAKEPDYKDDAYSTH
jgi:hypothetical protein